ncbi:MAG TPA: hypothetical protein VIP05_27175 [Burkholderiaceae bacterium]
MQHTCHHAARRAALRSRLASAGNVTIGTMILASVSAVALVLLSGCHATPAGNTASAFAGTAADKAVEARLGASDAAAPVRPVQPFDEGFVAAPVAED